MANLQNFQFTNETAAFKLSNDTRQENKEKRMRYEEALNYLLRPLRKMRIRKVLFVNKCIDQLMNSMNSLSTMKRHEIQVRQKKWNAKMFRTIFCIHFEKNENIEYPVREQMQ